MNLLTIAFENKGNILEHTFQRGNQIPDRAACCRRRVTDTAIALNVVHNIITSTSTSISIFLSSVRYPLYKIKGRKHKYDAQSLRAYQQHHGDAVDMHDGPPSRHRVFIILVHGRPEGHAQHLLCPSVRCLFSFIILLLCSRACASGCHSSMFDRTSSEVQMCNGGREPM